MACMAGAGCADEGAGPDGVLRAQRGPFDGELTIDPDPPRVGAHRVVVALASDGTPLEGAAVTISPWMPAHGHGSIDVEATETGPGTYEADDVWLNMPGIWDLRVAVDAEAHGDLLATVEVP